MWTAMNRRQGDRRQLAHQPYPHHRHNNNFNNHHHCNHRQSCEQLQLNNRELNDDNIRLRQYIDDLHQNMDQLSLQHDSLQRDFRNVRNDYHNMQRLHEAATKRISLLEEDLAELMKQQEVTAAAASDEQTMVEEEDTATAATPEEQQIAWDKFTSKSAQLSDKLHFKFRDEYIKTLDKDTQKAIEEAIVQLRKQRLNKYIAHHQGTNTAKFMASFDLVKYLKDNCQENELREIIKDLQKKPAAKRKLDG